MTNYTIALGNKNLQWSQTVVQNKLEALTRLKGKETAWICTDLTLASSNCLTRFVWHFVAKYFPLLREYLFGVNLDQTSSILNQLRQKIDPKSPLTEIFNNAAQKFNAIAPRHKVEEIIQEIVLPPPPKPASPKAQVLAPARALIEHFESCWQSGSRKFAGILYSNERADRRFESFIKEFQVDLDHTTHYGYIQKVDIPANSCIFVRADLHGDLRSLLSNLKKLQEEGLLDENYRCKPGFYFVILGDYSDRGTNSMQILELLAALKMENPAQVFMIRGNHEDVSINRLYCGNDPDFLSFLFPKKGNDEDDGEARQAHSKLLTKFYETMTLTLYMGEEGASKQYVQFTHGLFEPSFDPAPLLDSEEPQGSLPVPRKRELSARVSQIAPEPETDYAAQLADTADKAQRRQLKQLLAAQKISAFLEKENRFGEDIPLTAYNWGDMADFTQAGSLGNRTWTLSPTDVQHYLRLSSTRHKVKMVFRGHQHQFQNHKLANKLVVVTLPVGMDSEGYAKRYLNQKDRAYMMATAPKVKAWKKQAFLRNAGETDVQVTGNYPMQADAI